MTKKYIIPVALVALVASGAAGGLAFAKERGDATSDLAAMANAKVTLQQAITTAEQQAGGKAVGAGVDNENGTVRIAVEVASAQGMKTVLVDPQNGQVTATHTGDQADEDQD
jgi:uncharacterized membrane protein YkoI